MRLDQGWKPLPAGAVALERRDILKELILYTCEFCGTNYSDKCRCEKCEKGHKVPKKIHREKYLSIGQDAKGYPAAVDIEMDNGDIVRYKR